MSRCARQGSLELGTRSEIKNLNSFRALERSVAYEIQRQSELLAGQARWSRRRAAGMKRAGETFPQRSKEDADDYRYFPEPDLPPLVMEPEWIEQIAPVAARAACRQAAALPGQYGLSRLRCRRADRRAGGGGLFRAGRCSAAQGCTPKAVANWISGELFGLLNQAGTGHRSLPREPRRRWRAGEHGRRRRDQPEHGQGCAGRDVRSGKPAAEIDCRRRGLRQISDQGQIAGLVQQVLAGQPRAGRQLPGGKETLARWLFGQVMPPARGQANPQVIQQELERQLAEHKSGI